MSAEQAAPRCIVPAIQGFIPVSSRAASYAFPRCGRIARGQVDGAPTRRVTAMPMVELKKLGYALEGFFNRPCPRVRDIPEVGQRDVRVIR